jgi:micrococcal nuclease
MPPAATPPLVTTLAPAIRPAGDPTPPPGLPRARVTRVVDGDTIDVRLDGREERVRLIGINTPESVDPRRPVECFGQEASAYAKALLSGQTVALEADSSQADRDQYGRLLRYVWLDDGRLFNQVMIAEGYAYEYTYDLPYKYQALFRAAQQAAQAAGRGLWSPQTCAGRRAAVTTPAPNITPVGGADPAGVPGAGRSCPPGYPVKGNINRRGDKIYHVPGSQDYAAVGPERCFATAADAEAAGFRPPRR